MVQQSYSFLSYIAQETGALDTGNVLNQTVFLLSFTPNKTISRLDYLFWLAMLTYSFVCVCLFMHMHRWAYMCVCMWTGEVLLYSPS